MDWSGAACLPGDLARSVEGRRDTAPRLPARPWATAGRLAVRWSTFAARSVSRGHLDFATRAALAECDLVRCFAGNALFGSTPRHGCNLCAWQGRHFLPNVGPGYDERGTICPGCGCLARHRSLVAILRRATGFFSTPCDAIEVAPPRRFQELCLATPGLRYTSFDLSRFAMERGDLTRMRYADDSADYFLCYHVLEHVPHETTALAEIRRVLRPGGALVVQVPIDWSVAKTFEYPAPDPREAGHVRRYGRDFAERMAGHGFEVESVAVDRVCTESEIRVWGLDPQPVFLCRKR